MTVALLSDTALPFNRKERYFTGTVLPMLVCANNFAHFDRLTDLVGLGRLSVDASRDSANIQFFTEYSFAEAMVGSTKDRFPNAPTRKDTPDVMIYVAGAQPTLIALEAKMYDRPSTADLNEQLEAQAALLGYIAGQLGVDEKRVAHVALLPEAFLRDVGPLLRPAITWEQIRDAFSDVGPTYFLDVLSLALERYDVLASHKALTFGVNAEVKLTGDEIYRTHRDGTIASPWMGRRGGLHGPVLEQDVATGAWRTQRYECSSKAVGNANWFSVADFVAKVDALASQKTVP